MTYAFTFDASACSGCKACQEACKDKNNLPTGILWRRVVEVNGGEWRQAGKAWENSVFAYNLSLACNHCTHPKCAGVCPTDAFSVRPDGIVLLDTSKCMGCGYCNWACPYGAPQYDRTHGVMTKCNFCYDNLDAGIPPTCVAACPLRVLEYGSVEELADVKKQTNLWQLPGAEHPYPLPKYSRTEPHLAIRPHPAMSNQQARLVGNREEILPPGSIESNQRIAAGHELPLVAFTLLTQMAAGMAVGGLVHYPLPLLALLTIGLVLGAGGVTSFLHLGRKRNAWRAVTHLRKSWLSREVLMAGLFGIAWAATSGWQWVEKGNPTYWPMAIVASGLVYTMSRVYRLRAVPGWNTWHTQATFILSAITLGVTAISFFTPLSGWVLITGMALAIELGLGLETRSEMYSRPGALRLIMLGMGILVAILISMAPQLDGVWMKALIFTLILIEEVIGRWQFYIRRSPFPSN